MIDVRFYLHLIVRTSEELKPFSSAVQVATYVCLHQNNGLRSRRGHRIILAIHRDVKFQVSPQEEERNEHAVRFPGAADCVGTSAEIRATDVRSALRVLNPQAREECTASVTHFTAPGTRASASASAARITWEKYVRTHRTRTCSRPCADVRGDEN